MELNIFDPVVQSSEPSLLARVILWGCHIHFDLDLPLLTNNIRDQHYNERGLNDDLGSSFSQAFDGFGSIGFIVSFLFRLPTSPDPLDVIHHQSKVSELGQTLPLFASRIFN